MILKPSECWRIHGSPPDPSPRSEEGQRWAQEGLEPLLAQYSSVRGRVLRRVRDRVISARSGGPAGVWAKSCPPDSYVESLVPVPQTPGLWKRGLYRDA